MKVQIQYLIGNCLSRRIWLGKDSKGGLTLGNIYLNENTACDEISETDIENLLDIDNTIQIVKIIGN